MLKKGGFFGTHPNRTALPHRTHHSRSSGINCPDPINTKYQWLNRMAALEKRTDELEKQVAGLMKDSGVN